MTLEQEPDPLRRIPTKHTSALRAEIGPILRAARLKRGQSLEAVAQQTRISKRFLEALEENRFELPEGLLRASGRELRRDLGHVERGPC
jgi:ribosome-binding protein aMBF1 (putative translation factor)